MGASSARPRFLESQEEVVVDPDLVGVRKFVEVFFLETLVMGEPWGAVGQRENEGAASP